MRLSKYFFILASFVILLAFFEIFAGNFYYLRDFSAYTFPLKHFLRSEILKSNFPFLNPYLNLDTPFFANPKSGVLYPVSLILYILPIIPGLKVYIILHFIIAYLAMYYFLRHSLNIPESAAIYGGLMLALSGFLLSLVEYLSILSTLAWFPLALVFIKKAVEGEKVKYWIFTGLIFSLQYLGGKPDHAALCITLGYLFALHIAGHNKKEYLRTTLRFFFSGVVFLLLCMVHILPFLDFFIHSDRGAGTFEQITRGSIHPLEMLKFIMPNLFGNYAFDVKNFWFGQIYFLSFYIGITPLLFSLFSFYNNGYRRNAAKFFAVLFFVAIFLSLGRFTPLYSLLFRYFFPIRFMQYPSKFIYFAIFALVVLSSIGFCNYLTLISNRRFDIIARHARNLIITAIVLVFLLPFLFFLLHRNIVSQYAQFCAIFAILAVLLMFLSNKKVSTSQFASCIIVFSIANLFCYNLSINPVQKDDFLTKAPRIAEFLEDSEDGRIFFLDDREKSIFLFRNYNWDSPDWKKYHAVHKELMYPNMNLIYGFSTPDSMLVLEPEPNARDALDVENVNLMSLFNVKYIYSVKEIDNSAYEPAEEIRYDEFLYPLRLYRNKNFLPKCFVAGRFRIIEERAEALEAMKKSNFNPRQEIILENLPEEHFLKELRGKDVNYRIITSTFDSNKTEVDLETEGDGLLFISRRYFPDWKCTVNGKQASLYRADVFFQAVPVQKGRNSVMLSYVPRTFIYGAAISLFTLISLLGYFLFTRKID